MEYYGKQLSYFTSGEQLINRIIQFDGYLGRLYEALDEISKHQDELVDVTNRVEPVFLKCDQYPADQQQIAQSLKFRLINEYHFLNFRTEQELGIEDIFKTVCESYASAETIYRHLYLGSKSTLQYVNERALPIIRKLTKKKGYEPNLGFLLFYNLHGAYRTVVEEEEEE